MALRQEVLPNAYVWWRIADPAWSNRLDPRFAERWNPPSRFASLYLNEDKVTAHLNLRAFVAQWPYEPEDLRDDTDPILVGAALPRRQRVCDAHSRAGALRAGLPETYPVDADGVLVPHTQCQPIGAQVKAAGLRGVRARSAQSRDGAGRELAWFQATARSVALRQQTVLFEAWFWS